MNRPGGDGAEQPVRLAPKHQLSRTQELIWASERIHRGAPIGNMPNVSTFGSAIDPERFVAAVHHAVMAHESLRTRFVDVGGVPHPQVVDIAPAATEIVSLAPADLDDWLNVRLTTPIDLTVAPYDSVLIESAGTWTWLMNIHHLATDATSSALVFQAVASAYHGLDVQPSSFLDHYEALTARQQEPRWTKASEHWSRWSEEAGPYRRPELYHPARTADTEASRVEVALTSEQRTDLRVLLDTDLKMLSPDLALAAFLAVATATYRYRLTGDPRCTIGVPVHNRDRSSMGVVGPLIELFPMDVEIEPGDSFRSVHSRVAKALFGVLGQAQPETSPDQLFDVVLNVSTAQFGMFGDIDASTRWVPSGAVDPNHALRVQSYDWDGHGELQLALDVNHAVADKHQRALAGRHFAAVVDAALRDLDADLGSFVLVTVEEQEQSQRYNQSGPGAMVAETVPAAMHRLLRQRTDPVIADSTGSFTGVEFADRIDAVAAVLQAQGIGRGDVVGIRMPGSIDAVTAIHAVLRTGAAFTPIDPDYPEERQRHIRDDAGLALVLDTIPSLDDVDDVDAVDAATLRPVDPNLEDPDLEDPAYLIYTSGSTGLPKGVPISHRGLAEYVAFAAEGFTEHGQPDADAPVVALHSSLSFDLTITSLFLPFLVGGTLRVFAAGGAVALADLVADGQTTWVKATPSHLELLLRLTDGSLSLKHLVVGGEAFTTDLARRLADAFPGVRIFNEYGPTEGVVGVMIHEFDDQIDTDAAVPIGVPAPGVELHVLDDHQQPTPFGVPGELYLSRPGMTAGYHNRPELTAERFVHLPHISDTVLYRTGDSVAMLDSIQGSTQGSTQGSMVYLGRIDEQIKAQGVRLEPAEVEAAINTFPGIAQSAVRLWSADSASVALDHCPTCGLPTNVPGVSFDADGVCSTCAHFESVKDQAQAYFRTLDDLAEKLADARRRATGDYDVLHLLSGGKDSTYALYELVRMGARVFALTLDNGFISEGAKDNARRAVNDLGVDHEFVTTDAMNEIFRDSLERFSNVCNGCYKTIYTLSVNRAHELGIPYIVTGLSRGQLFETRLTPAQFTVDRFDPDAIDAAVLEARKVYHRTPDAVSELLDVSLFATDDIFDEVQYIDFYRYTDVELEEMLRFLDESAPWLRPDDTGRSTNCLVNAAGIAVHKMEQGYHSYALPYSWDVKLGHKTWNEAVEELDDPVEDDAVKAMLSEIGYTPKPVSELTAWIVAEDPAVVIDPTELRQHVADRVPSHAVPSQFVTVDEISLSPNGKVATEALPAPTLRRDIGGERTPASTPVEESLVNIWSEVLGLHTVGVDDDFFELGGTSLKALEMIVWVAESYEIDLPEVVAFQHRTIQTLAAEVEKAVLESVLGLSGEDLNAALADLDSGGEQT